MPGGDRKNADGLLAMAMATGFTVAEAAKKAGVSEATAYRRLREPEFKQKVSEIRGSMVAQVSGQLVDAGTEAVRTLRSLLTAESESVRLAASKAVLELGAKFRESTELEERIKALEEAKEWLQQNGSTGSKR